MDQQENNRWQQRALEVANDAHNNRISIRRGVESIGEGRVVYWDNNPTDDRDDRISEVIAEAKKNGISLAARAGAGDPGDEYTLAFVFDGGTGDCDDLALDVIASAVQQYVGHINSTHG